METNEYYDSLPRIACLAALELEQLKANEDSPLEYVSKFVTMLNNNMNMEGSKSYKDLDFSTIDPLTGYAVRKALIITSQNNIQNVEDFINSIAKHITEPLSELTKPCGTEKKYTKEDIDTLGAICLSIAQVYSAFAHKNDKFENHPFR